MALPDYSKFVNYKLELRDYLALERTILSNERTLLSYLQNALAIGVTGITGLYAIDGVYARVAGIGFVALSFFVACVGFVKFRAVRRRLDKASPAGTAAVAVEEMSKAQPQL